MRNERRMVEKQATFGLVQVGVVLLALATAIIHIVLALPTNLIMMFYLNGAGYIGLTAALYLPQLAVYRRRLRWVLIGYTAITIVGWAVVGERSLIAYLDKLIEAALIGLLAIEVRQEGER